MMYENKSFLAIIPARGGGKRLPGKNILPLAGKPLIAWSILAGIGSKYLDEVMVSSDDDEIIKIAGQYNANVPFKRPIALATDEASTADVIRHVLDFYRTKYNREFDYIVLLQPTSPLRNSAHIDEAIEQLCGTGASSVISVSKVQHSPLWMNTLPETKDMKGFLDKSILDKRSQELPVFYQLNGAVYICEVSSFLDSNSLFLDEGQFAYVMDAKSSVDVDDEIDFKLCELLLDER